MMLPVSKMFSRPHAAKAAKAPEASVDGSANMLLDIIKELVKTNNRPLDQSRYHHSPPRSPRSRREIPSIAEFLSDLDIRMGQGDYYIGLTPAFEKEEIAVDTIPYLTDQQFNNLGVSILGRQLRLRAEAEKYCGKK
jgi:hypothetical protein